MAGEETPGAGRIRLSAAECEPREVMDALQSLPLFGGCQVVIVSEAEPLLDEKRYPGLLERLKDLDGNTLLVLKMQKPLPARQLAANEIVVWFLEKRAAVYCYAPSTETEAVRWVLEHAARRGVKIASDAVPAVVERVGLDPEELASEIAKLGMAAEGPITRRTVDELLSDHRERAATEWAESVLAGDSRAVALAARATDSGRDGIRAVSILFGKLSDIAALAQGEEIPAFRRPSIEVHARRWPAERIDRALETLLELDLALKSKPIDQASARIELATLKLLDL